MNPHISKNFNQLGLSGIAAEISNLVITYLIAYLDFLKLQMKASFILTDSGGIQVESTIFGVPSLTLRENTESPITITEETNQLVQLSSDANIKAADMILNGTTKKGR